MKKRVLLLPLLLALTAAAQDFDYGDDKDILGDPKTKAMCRQVKATPIPAADRPTPQQAAALKGCDAETLYFGIGAPKDVVKARHCAYSKLNTPADDSFYGSRAILMMVYANGDGVPRNIDLAIHMVCGIEDSAPAEYDGRIEHLLEMKKAGAKAERIDFCDDITSGYAGGFCASHEQDIAKEKRKVEYRQIMAGWTPAQRAAFAKLEKARDAFSDARVEGEVDVSGTGRAMFMIDAEEGVAEGFLKLLKRLEAGQGGPAGALAAADKELNATYRKVQDAKDFDYGTVKKTGIRDTQRAWIKYRDAWLAFAKVKYPAVPPEALSAILTAERTAQLKEFTE